MQEMVGSVARGNLMVVMGDMNARVGCDVSIWVKSLVEMGRKFATKMAGGYCSSAVSTISGLQTPGFHTKEYSSTPGNQMYIGAEG